MINPKILVICTLSVGVLANCSKVLQSVDLQINAEDSSIQEEFNVIEKTLTLEEARKQIKTTYSRTVVQNGRGENAQSIPEIVALKSKFPKNVSPFIYRIGVGDKLSLSRLIENNRSTSGSASKWPPQKGAADYKLGIGDILALTLMNEHQDQISTQGGTGSDSTIDSQIIFNPQQTQLTVESTGRVGSDGSVLLLKVGRLEAEGKTLNQLRSEVRNILIQNGVSPRFQLEISEFNSQKVYLTISSLTRADSSITTLNDQETTLVDLLTSARVTLKAGVVTNVKLKRKNDIYVMALRDVLNENSPKIKIQDRDHIFVEDSSANIVSSVSTVDSNGEVVFEGTGKIKAKGLSIDQLRNSIASLIQRLPDSQNAFQIRITEFNSQNAVVSIPGQTGGVIPIQNKMIPLDEVLTVSGLSPGGESITRVNLLRDGENYSFTLDELLQSTTDRIFLQANDRITTEILSYKKNKVFILGAVNPQIFNINPANRETLADVLFSSGGPLSTSSAKRSEVYLLRGTNPVVAYHLDAQSPTRLIVADAMELRPNDILYVAEQPIISFNRTLATIVPLRILLRDIQDENIP